MVTVAALFVAKGGGYYGLPGVDPWDEQRDARLYAGPHPVVAHPPCQRWGRYWHGGPNSIRFPRVRQILGDDSGCFSTALASVRRWGGVLEHPADSHAWRRFNLPPPLAAGWWLDVTGGWCCRVEQGHYGHRARKATWLYYVGITAPSSLHWGPSVATAKLDDGFQSAEQRADYRARGIKGGPSGMLERLSHRERLATPPAFRDVLLAIARSAR